MEKKGRARKLSDADLRACLEQRMKPADIARKFGVSQAAVSQRIKQLNLTTAAAAVAPKESERFVSQTIDAMEELGRCLHRANKLQDACDEWLRDADQPDRYDIGPRAHEVTVVYSVEVDLGEDRRGRPRTKIEKRKAKLSSLLALVDTDPAGDPIVEKHYSETKHADPRELILKTAAECRQTISTVAELAKMLADAKVMEEFRKALLAEIAQVSPEVAQAIAERVRRSLILHNAFRGPDSLPGR